MNILARILLLIICITNLVIFCAQPDESEEVQRLHLSVPSSSPIEKIHLPMQRNFFRFLENLQILNRSADRSAIINALPSSILGLMYDISKGDLYKWSHLDRKDDTIVWLRDIGGVVVKEHIINERTKNRTDDLPNFNLVRGITGREDLPLYFVPAIIALEFNNSDCIFYERARGESLNNLIIRCVKEGRSKDINNILYQIGKDLFGFHKRLAPSFDEQPGIRLYSDSRSVEPILYICNSYRNSSRYSFNYTATSVCMGDFHSSNIFIGSRESGELLVSVIDFSDSLPRDINREGSSIANDVGYFVFTLLVWQGEYFSKNHGVSLNSLEDFVSSFIMGYMIKLSAEERSFFGAHINLGYTFFLENLAVPELKNWRHYIQAEVICKKVCQKALSSLQIQEARRLFLELPGDGVMNS